MSLKITRPLSWRTIARLDLAAAGCCLVVAVAMAGSPSVHPSSKPSPNTIALCKIDPAHCNDEQNPDPGYGVQSSENVVTLDSLAGAVVRLERRVDALEAARNGGRR